MVVAKRSTPKSRSPREFMADHATTWPYRVAIVLLLGFAVAQHFDFFNLRPVNCPPERRMLSSLPEGFDITAGACAPCNCNCTAPPSTAGLEQQISQLTVELENSSNDRIQLKEQLQQALASAAAAAQPPCDVKENGNVEVDLRRQVKDLKQAFDRLQNEKVSLEMKGEYQVGKISEKSMENAEKLVLECGKQAANGLVLSNVDAQVWKGYACEATEEELKKYFDFTPREPCPDDWFFVQELIYKKNCFALPKRRCLNRTPVKTVKVKPFPASLFDQESLDDHNVAWGSHWCKSFECLNTRAVGDCRNCFNMSLESYRWQQNYRGGPSIKEVIRLTGGSLRLGLDVGGGTGSFAAHMALHNVTVMTTAYNVETVKGRMQGLPYMEAIALRGVIPLHLPHKARLPFFDNTLDLIHSVNSIKYLSLLEFEELIFEWNRVLRPGGIMWFEMFYTAEDEMPVYISILELLHYSKLYWNLTPKPDFGERAGNHVYLNCLIQKPETP